MTRQRRSVTSLHTCCDSDAGRRHWPRSPVITTSPVELRGLSLLRHGVLQPPHDGGAARWLSPLPSHLALLRPAGPRQEGCAVRGAGHRVHGGHREGGGGEGRSDERGGAVRTVFNAVHPKNPARVSGGWRGEA